jgi:Peptidase S24-like
MIDSVVYHAEHKSIFQYAIQAQKHISMCNGSFISRRMEKTADEKREILRKFINERGLKIARWCKESGVDKNSVYNFLNSHSQSLDLRTYGKLARTAQVPVWKLSGDQPQAPSPTLIWVAGDVQAGAFREAVEWEQSNWYGVDVPVPNQFRGRAKALEIRGTSMNVDYPEGSIAIWVPMLDFRPPRHGDDVLVYSYCHDGLIEATLKEFRLDNSGGRWLWPRSHDPLHQAPVDIANPGDAIREIEIAGIVIGSYRPRHH